MSEQHHQHHCKNGKISQEVNVNVTVNAPQASQAPQATETFSAAYGNFWSDEFQTVPLGQPFSFNLTGPTAGGVALLNPNTILVPSAGDYLVTYTVTVNLSHVTSFPYLAGVNITINGTRVFDAKIQFGEQFSGTNIVCTPLHGETILSIPANATVQLINSIGSDDISTCDGGINAAVINLVKLN